MQATIYGNVTRDPEVFSSGEWNCLKFGMANNDDRKKKKDSEELETKPIFIDLEYWTKNLDYWVNKIRKGVFLIACCNFKMDKWEDKNGGGQRTRLIFVVQGTPTIKDKSAGSERYSEPEPSPGTDYEKEDIPF